MFHIAVQIKELVSSNVTSMVASASDPAKMLNLLRQEIEESIITLVGEQSRAKRQSERFTQEIAQLETRVADWGEKARFAVEKKREDLARAALLAREATRRDIEDCQAAFASNAQEIADIEDAMSQLETKLAETREQIAALGRSAPASSASAASDEPSKAERNLDRIAALEKRVQFAGDGQSGPSDAAINAEIASLETDARIEAELAALKKKGAASSKRAQKS